MEVRVLEIGVAGGASLRVWEAFFKMGTIIGADIDSGAVRFARPRVHIEIIDQSVSADLLRVGETHGPFDIIIEDGSHMWAHQITTLKALFPFVKEGGIYIVEDLQTNYGQMRAGFRGDSIISCVDYIKKLVDIRVADSEIDVSLESDEFLRDYGRKMDSITFYRESCLIQKCVTLIRQECLLTLGNDDAAKYLRIRAHIGGYGDRISSSAAIRGGIEGQNIQGFRVICDASFREKIAYRARLADGRWTEWAKCDCFVGTFGKSRDLTGFSFRLDGPSEDEYDVAVIGAFGDVGSDVIVGNGEACVPKDIGKPLWGMQVSMIRKESTAEIGN